jgi:predicted GNAT family acetyltransferase
MHTEVSNAPERSRYELFLDGELVGVADYRIVGDRVVMPHTEITPPLRGRGLGEILVGHALDDVRATGRTVVPSCWFVAEYIDAHPNYRDLLAS